MLGTEAIVTSTFLFLIPLVSASLNRPVECPKELMHQKIICEPGQALSSVTWDEKIPNCRRFNATCKNATSSCIEHCEWAPTCQQNASISIDMEYVRGIDVGYEAMEEQQTVLFLCCHSEDLKTGILDCDDKSLTELDGKSQPKLISIMAQATSKSSISVAGGMGEGRGDLPIKATYCPVVNIPTCPAEKIQTNVRLDGPGAGGGGGGGGYGLSLQSCYGQSPIIHHLRFSSSKVSTSCVGAGEAYCMAKCNADSECYAAFWNIQLNVCRIYGSDYRVSLTGDNNVWGYIKCITLRDIDDLKTQSG